jgi:hypothetical protein
MEQSDKVADTGGDEFALSGFDSSFVMPFRRQNPVGSGATD